MTTKLAKGVFEDGIDTKNPYFVVQQTLRGKKLEPIKFPYLPNDAASRNKSLENANKLATKEKTKTVHPGVYERGIDSKSPFFQVRIRHRGEKSRVERFPYLTDTDTNRKGTTRAAALNAAIAVSSEEKSLFHFYGKPKKQVADEHTLRDWITTWKLEACDLIDPSTKKEIVDPPERKAGIEDGKQIMRIVAIADAYAKEHNRTSMMDRRIVELGRSEFNGLHGFLKMLTGRAPKAVRGQPKPPKPPASPATQRRALALLGMVWNHARDNWNMDQPRPWKGVVVKSVERKKTTRALSIGEFGSVEKALAEVEVNTLAAIQFLRWTAARAGEMQKLRWEHISWPSTANGWSFPRVLLVGTKTPKQGAYREREFHLLQGAQDALALLYSKENGPPKTGIVFRSPTDPTKPLSRHTAYQALVRAVKRAGVPHAHLHDLRHTRTTELSMSLHKAQAMQITGHSDERTFMRYTHLAEDSGATIAEADKKRAKMVASNINAKPKSANDLAALLKDLPHEEKMKLIATLASS